MSLDPGIYRKVKVKKYATILLTGGDYFIEKFDTDPHSTVAIDLSAGPITINITKELDIDEYVEMIIDPASSGTTRDITINSLAAGKIKIENDARVLGTLIAPHAKVKMEDDGAIKGAIYADRISFDQGGLFLSHASTTPLPKKVMPQPAQIAAPTQLPEDFALYQNYPNPFNPETEIRYQLPTAGYVTLRIYDILGEEVVTLREAHTEAGSHSVIWDGKDARGRDVTSGIYFYRMEAQAGNGERFVATKKMSLLR